MRLDKEFPSNWCSSDHPHLSFSHNNKNVPAVFIGGGFRYSQYLFMIPVLDGYCRDRSINKIFLEFPLPTKVSDNEFIKQILRSYEVVVLGAVHQDWKQRIGFKLWTLAFILRHVWTSRRSLLFKQTSWTRCQIRHGIWDYAIKKTIGGKLNPSLIAKLRSTIRMSKAIQSATLLAKNGVVAAFIGLTVYKHRGMLATFRQLGVDVMVFRGSSIFRAPTHAKAADSDWCMPPHKIMAKLISSTDKKIADTYLSNRGMGASIYEDAVIAGAIENHNPTRIFPANVIMLHVFRDSPFDAIDRSRIFADYFQWIEDTLKIVGESQESWIVRLHPKYRRWGEDQQRIVNSIFRRVFGRTVPANIIIDDGERSNVDLFKSSRRIVTFSGTSSLEAACFGIRPILISQTMLSYFAPETVHKPATVDEYRKLLLSDSTAPIFKLSESAIDLSRSLLFIRENKLNFAREAGCGLFGDPDFNRVAATVGNHITYFNSLGQLLAAGYSHTVSERYLNEI